MRFLAGFIHPSTTSAWRWSRIITYKFSKSDEIYNVVGDASVRLAIVDDGFDLNHIDFSQNYSDAYNVISGSNVVSSSFERQHGTHVAGIATANSDNNIGSLGLAAKCTLLPIQIADDVYPKRLSSTHVIDGILYALNKGADVINLSLGGSIPGFEEWTQQDSVNFKNARYDESIFWSELYSKLEENNVMVVLAAGNESLPLELDPMHNSTYPVFVCASDPNNELAIFSNYPSQKNDSMTVVVAPGFIWSLVPNDNYKVLPGTSMSAPLVASVIALMKSEYPEISNDQIRSDLLSCPPVGDRNIPLVWMPSLFNLNELDS